MSALMPNIRELRDNLRETGWHMTGFPFTYKSVHYSVLCENLDNLLKHNDHSIILLTFIDNGQPDRQLKIEANSARFYVDAKTLREYFHISYSANLGDILSQFYSTFSTFIPREVSLNISEEIKSSIVATLCSRDGDNPKAIFCFSVYRNGIDPRSGQQKHRRIFNQDRARLLVPDLYEFFKDDTTISFCFSTEKEREQPSNVIIQKYASRYGR